ncbi:hypothetical protein HM003_03630 [Candidatus Bathyarchaeota archaeon A05DMB-5]|nr:hypothetical protein [Candidatus Bathyarchaeota archaeon A05DMB-5]
MILNQTSITFILLFSGVIIFIIIMLLPALFELKKPKDAGPRIIMNDIIIMQYLPKKKILPLQSMEEEKFGLDQAIAKKITEIIAILPNLET